MKRCVLSLVVVLGLLVSGDPAVGQVGVPGGRPSRPQPQHGTLQIDVNHRGTYQVEGEGRVITGHLDRVLQLSPGRYTVTASGGQVSAAVVRIWRGSTARVTVAFSSAPLRTRDVAVGDDTCAVLVDGGVVCWDNYSLDLNTRYQHRIKGISQAKAIAAGSMHYCVVMGDGTVRCWGSNSYGQVGVPPDEDSVPGPVEVPGLTGVTDIEAGGVNSCALRADGTAACWGSNGYGQLPGVDQPSSHTPVTLPLAGITDLSVGSSICAVLVDGTVDCWGENQYGHLGVGLVGDVPTPTPVVGLNHAASVVSEAGSTCVTMTDGVAKCWGANDSGKLGTGGEGFVTEPSPVLGVGPARQVWPTYAHTCALLLNGTVECWGHNESGELGVDTTQLQAHVVASGVTDAVQLETRGVTCARSSDGAVRCWGRDYLKETDGVANTVKAITVPSIDRARQVVTSGEHSCAVLRGGRLKCWGSNSNYQISAKPREQPWKPVRVTGVGRVRAVGAAGDLTCSLSQDGTVRCWGCWEGSIDPACDEANAKRHPFRVPGIAHAKALAVGEVHSCVLEKSGAVKCWGESNKGQLGRPGRAGYMKARAVLGITNARAISASGYHTCALLADGSVRCWGCVGLGCERGMGRQEAVATTPQVISLSRPATSISSNQWASCARVVGGRVYCWGMPIRPSREYNTPWKAGKVIGATRIKSVWGGGLYDTYGIRNDGSLVHWLGNGRWPGAGRPRQVAVPVRGLGLKGTTDQVAPGWMSSCLLTHSRHVRCWGDNANGQLGTPPIQTTHAVVLIEEE